MIKLSDYVFQFVSRLGVQNVFMLPGGGCMHLVDSLGRNRQLEYVCCLHEQAAVIAAEAYSQYTNQIGVGLVTTGPGGTNAITGVAGAWIDSTPLLMISGQVKRPDLIGESGLRQSGIQEVDIVSLVKPITKYAVTVMDPVSIRYHLEKAVFLARSGRPGPVWIDIPLDVQGSMIDESALEGFDPPAVSGRDDRGQLSSAVDYAVMLINASERPVILAGNGVRLSGGLATFLKLIEWLQIPVLTTWKAIDFLPEDHPLFFGRPGSVAQRGANFIQQNCDLILTLGARLDLAQTGFNHQHFCRRAKKIFVDVDETELKKLKLNIDLPICADANIFLNELALREKNIHARDRSAWLARCRAWKEKYPVTLPEYWRKKECVNTYVLIDVLSELLSEGDIFIPGSSGACSEISMQAFKVKKGQRVINSPGLGAMGFGLPASIGACLASGRRRTVSVIGDGGLQHNIQELETIARLKLPLKIFVLNNNGYGSIRHTQNVYFKGRLVASDPASGLSLPDACRVASAYGLRSAKLLDHEKIRERVLEILSKDDPVICEVMTDPDLVTAPRLSSELNPDGTMSSKPMEDLWPFLDRKEFYENLIIPPTSS